jgi:hypothetical protein
MSMTRINKTGEPQVNLAGDGTATPRPWDGGPTPLQLALARGHRWLAMLESGNVKSLKQIAKRESVATGYVSRMANLTALAPEIVAAISTRHCRRT